MGREDSRASLALKRIRTGGQPTGTNRWGIKATIGRAATATTGAIAVGRATGWATGPSPKGGTHHRLFQALVGPGVTGGADVGHGMEVLAANVGTDG